MTDQKQTEQKTEVINPAAKEEIKPPVAVKDDHLDDLGYSTAPETKEAPKPPEEKKDPPKEDEVKVLGGYDEKDKDPPAKPPEEKKDPPAPTSDNELGFELKFDPAIPKEEIAILKKFAKDNEYNQKQAQALLDMRKSQIETLRANFEKAKVEHQKKMEEDAKATRAEWRKELRDDKTFGGEKYDQNIKRVSKLVNDFMTDTNKVLTERGSMLPPYVMRDLLKIADKLYTTEKLTQGGPVIPKQETEEMPDELAFYVQ